MSSTKEKKQVSRLLQTDDCHIGIIGSGLAGLSCALAIIRSSPTFQGRITIYERKLNHTIQQTASNHECNNCSKEEEVQGHGYGMTITYNPDGPLAKLGILEEVAQEDCPSRCHYIFDNQGYIRGYFGNAFYKQVDNGCKSSSRGAGQRGNLRIPRARLRSILFNALMSEAGKVEEKNMNTGNTSTDGNKNVNEESETTTTSSPRGMVKVLWNKKLNSYNDTLMMEKLYQITSSGKQKDIKNTIQQQQMKNQDDKAVIVHFEDGTIDQVDLLIGADGVYSSVARQYLSTTIPSRISSPEEMISSSSNQPRHLGIFLILGISNHFHSHIDERGFYTLDGTHRLFIMPFQGSVLTDDVNDDDDDNVNQRKKRNRRTMWQLSFPIPSDRSSEEVLRLKQMSQEEMQQEVLSRIGDWHDPVPNLVKDTPLSSIWGTSLLDRDPTVFIEQRSKLEVHGRIPSRVVLVGDASHSMSPFKGQGANQALADGPLLASWLTKSKPESAVRGFMTEMARRSGVKVRASRESAKRLHSKDSCWQWMFQQETKHTGGSIQAVFHGVQPQNVTLLLQTLKDRGVTASLGSKLDDAIRGIISQLNISETTLPQNPEIISKDNHQEMTQLESQALEYASTGNISKLRELSLKSHLIIPNALDDSKRTCLHLAALNNNTDVCRWLLSEVNIDCNLLDVDGKRAIDLAGSEETTKLLTRWMKQAGKKVDDTATPSTSINRNKDNPSNVGEEAEDLYRHIEQQLRGIRSMKQLKALLEKNRDAATSTDHTVTHVLGCKVDHGDLEYEKQCTKTLAEEHGAVLLRNFISREVDQAALAALALRPLGFDVSGALDRLRVAVDSDEYFDAVTKLLGSKEELIPKSKQKSIDKCIEDIKSQLTIPSDDDIIAQTNFFPEQQNENQTKKRKIDSFPGSRLRYINLGEMNYNWGARCYDKVPNASKLPGRLVSLAQNAHKIALRKTNEASTSPVSFDMAICNMYHLSRPSDRLGGHRDNVESDVSLPLVTISLGAPGIFLLGGKSRGDRPTVILLRSGDCLILSGKSRRYYHGVPTILTNEVDSDNIATTTESYCVFPELQSSGSLIDNNNNGHNSIPSSDEMKFAKVFLSSVRMNMSIRQVSS